MKQETKCIQAGYEPGNGESRMIPIIQSTTFKYDSSEAMGRLFDLEESGYFYTRSSENLRAGRWYGSDADFFRAGGFLLFGI